ncbi:hypothetical protein Tharo_2156 [Thauera aromatica K172]|uniref:Uncharacterized protein n=2 Tax=Thauera aromatica TaxID=59405 RepID=A0A2R4BP14_THAAR|nr:hypothetical protein Tharo_2156 [Thauera aromatica K172]
MEADSPHELATALMNFAVQIERGEVSKGVSGGCSSGAIYELLHAPEQTHEAYFEQVREYLASKSGNAELKGACTKEQQDQ